MDMHAYVAEIEADLMVCKATTKEHFASKVAQWFCEIENGDVSFVGRLYGFPHNFVWGDCELTLQGWIRGKEVSFELTNYNVDDDSYVRLPGEAHLPDIKQALNRTLLAMNLTV